MTALNVESEKPIADVLNNIEAELLQVGQLLGRLQVTFSPLLHTAACTNDLHRDVQSLDLIAQQVQGLAALMGNLASVVAPEWLVAPKEIVATLALQALANRICGEPIAHGGEVGGGFEML